MGAFTDAEQAYLRGEHPLGRLASVGPDGTPHVMPVGMYTLDDETNAIEIRGHDLAATKKFRDVARTGRAAFVIDDVLPPWRPRGIEVRGRAEAIDAAEPVIRLHPERIVAWGLDDTGQQRNARDVKPPRDA